WVLRVAQDPGQRPRVRARAERLVDLVDAGLARHHRGQVDDRAGRHGRPHREAVHLAVELWHDQTDRLGRAGGGRHEVDRRGARASRCFAAASRFVKSPVDSITTSTPRSLHGRSAGSRSASTRTSRPSTSSAPSRTATLPGNGPYTESYLSRWPRVPASVMSL